ncbi:hypothetical protein JTE90_020289 [Oedothorax gibbosus]|uniref:Uncharacterized protein n=1 Tax=Oedothorax gibbosus TaxID=931172 RepID=A0AAV6VMJ0_9ARAC|nr:hypothetical protein JTE90_020289 [Oedothorax gibbosus]
MALPDPSLVTPTPFASAAAHASSVATTSGAAAHVSSVPFATTPGGSSVAYVYSVPFATTPGGSSAAYVLPFATTGSSAASATVSSDTTPVTSATFATPVTSAIPVVTSATTGSTCAAVASLPAPRLWRRDWTRRQRTAAQAHAIVFEHRTYFWEDDDAPGMGSTLRADMNDDTTRVAPPLNLMCVEPAPLDLSRPCASAAS